MHRRSVARAVTLPPSLPIHPITYPPSVHTTLATSPPRPLISYSNYSPSLKLGCEAHRRRRPIAIDSSNPHNNRRACPQPPHPQADSSERTRRTAYGMASHGPSSYDCRTPVRACEAYGNLCRSRPCTSLPPACLSPALQRRTCEASRPSHPPCFPWRFRHPHASPTPACFSVRACRDGTRHALRRL